MESSGSVKVQLTAVMVNGTTLVTYETDRSGQVAVTSFLVILFSASMACNFLVIVTVCLSHSLRRLTFNLLLLNLCVTSICDAVNMALSAVYVVLLSTASPTFCAVSTTTGQVAVTMLTWAILVLWVDRTLAVCHPTFYNATVTLGVLRVVLAIVWLSGVLLCFPVVFSMIRSAPYKDRFCCGVADPGGYVYTAGVSVVGFLVPYLTVVLCALRVYVAYRRHRRKMAKRVFTAGGLWTNELPNLTVLVVLGVLYVLLVLPHVLTVQIQQLSYNGTTTKEAQQEIVTGTHDSICIWLRYIYSALVPAVVLAMRKEIRSKAETLFCCCCTNNGLYQRPIRAYVKKEEVKVISRKSSAFKEVASVKTPVLFVTSQGLHLRLLHEQFEGFSDHLDQLEMTRSNWSLEPRFKCEFCDLFLPLNTDEPDEAGSSLVGSTSTVTTDVSRTFRQDMSDIQRVTARSHRYSSISNLADTALSLTARNGRRSVVSRSESSLRKSQSTRSFSDAALGPPPPSSSRISQVNQDHSSSTGIINNPSVQHSVVSEDA